MRRATNVRQRNLKKKAWLLPSVFCLLSPQALFAQEHAGQYSRADIEYGYRLYGAQCASCHGPNGDLVSGVNLGSGKFRNASTDQDLNRIITNGLPGTAMPAGKVNQAELAGLVAYIRMMRSFDPAGAVTLGDARPGQTVFEGKGDCTRCHRVSGTGPRVAPDLSDIGAVRAAGMLQRSLLDPSGAMLPINRSVRAVTRDGKVINGRRLNEDTYSVQLIDEQERLVSLVKADLREYAVLTTSSMPSYKGRLNAQELADVLAYLLSLKGSN
jgi:putative heme-binding domain-containing protein